MKKNYDNTNYNEFNMKANNKHFDAQEGLKNVTSKDSKEIGYSFYSRILEKPFDSIDELKKAEAAHYSAQRAKEDKAAAKKADAKKVEEAFKILNQARKIYKKELTALTNQYSEDLRELKTRFESTRDEIKKALAIAEDNYANALKDFTAAHPEGYHVTLRDGDFETTISHKSVGETVKADTSLFNSFFDLFFGF